MPFLQNHGNGREDRLSGRVQPLRERSAHLPQLPFHDQQASRQCREPAIPEGVKDKERRNLCEYFKAARLEQDDKCESASSAARRKLEELFKKQG